MTYIASPFFCPYDVAVRDRMLEKVEEIYGDEYFRPDCTDSNGDYDKHPTEEVAKKIYEDNINHIQNCGVLIFPKHTTDLGTMMEVGYATALQKAILMYDYLNGTITDITMELRNFLDCIEIEDNMIVNCKTVAGGIVFGYCVAKVKNLGYTLGNNRDNIMLHVSAKRYDDNYKPMEVDIKDVQ